MFEGAVNGWLGVICMEEDGGWVDELEGGVDAEERLEGEVESAGVGGSLEVDEVDDAWDFIGVGGGVVIFCCCGCGCGCCAYMYGAAEEGDGLVDWREVHVAHDQQHEREGQEGVLSYGRWTDAIHSRRVRPP